MRVINNPQEYTIYTWGEILHAKMRQVWADKYITVVQYIYSCAILGVNMATQFWTICIRQKYHRLAYRNNQYNKYNQYKQYLTIITCLSVQYLVLFTQGKWYCLRRQPRAISFFEGK